MPSIEYDDVYKRALAKINDLDLANYTEEDFREYMKEWLHSAISKPYSRKKFSNFSFDDDLEEINFSLADSVDDDYDSQFVISALAKGLIVNYLPSKLETTANLAIMIGGKEEKKLLDTYSKNIERLDKLRKEWELAINNINFNSTFDLSKYKNCTKAVNKIYDFIEDANVVNTAGEIALKKNPECDIRNLNQNPKQ